MFLLPLRTDSPLRNTPWMNWAIILANVVVFILQDHVAGLTDHLILNAKDPHVYAFITYAFLHVTWLHLAGNLLALWIFGHNVNDRLGQLGYLAFYLAGAVIAGEAFILTHGQLVEGASGAVGAVMGAYLALLPRSHVTILNIFFFVRLAEIPSMIFIVGYFLFNIAMSFAAPDAPSAQVAYVAHVAGMLFGFTLCFLLLLFHLLDRNQWDFLALAQRWNRRRQFRTLVRQGYNPFSPPAPAAKTALPTDARANELRLQIQQAFLSRNVPLASQIYVKLKSLDPAQVLARQQQLDVANQLASDHAYPDAADAYEQFLKSHPRYENVEQVHLMLGIVYARHLNNIPQARHYLTQALSRLHTDREIKMAREELALLPPTDPPSTK